MNTKKELLKLIEEIGVEFQNFPWENREAYGHYLAQTYFYVRHTTCFLALTASRWGVKNRTQQYRALSHLKEELSHDSLLLDDLKAIGKSIDDYQEWPITQAFYQTQYYWIEHETPAAHLGYAYMLEGMASQKAPEASRRIMEAHGKDTASFLKTHGEEDVDHFESGLKNLEHFNTFELRCLEQCAKQAFVLYSQLLSTAKSKA